MFLGYSLGSAVSLAASERVEVDGLALIAPFWWRERGWMRVLGEAIRPFLPSNFRPLSKANFDDPRFREGLAKFLPGTDLDDPEARESLRHLRFPLSIVEQIREISVVAFAAAGDADQPVLMVQGLTDPVVRIPATKKLAGQFPNGVRYTEVDGGHDIVQADKPTWDKVSQTVMTFAETLEPV
jgi:pimeloyl-ACP methyl ester carboxylesterase